jgi:hypothetical protein
MDDLPSQLANRRVAEAEARSFRKLRRAQQLADGGPTAEDAGDLAMVTELAEKMRRHRRQLKRRHTRWIEAHPS